MQISIAALFMISFDGPTFRSYPFELFHVIRRNARGDQRMLGIVKRIIDLVHRWYDPIGHARRLGVTIGKECRLLGVDFSTEPYLVTIGDHVSATRTQFLTHDGSVWVFRETHPEIDVVRPIRVGNNVFLGFGVVVLPGVTIGDNVVVGAGSVVTRDVPSNCVVAGVPAKFIR